MSSKIVSRVLTGKRNHTCKSGSTAKEFKAKEKTVLFWNDQYCYHCSMMRASMGNQKNPTHTFPISAPLIYSFSSSPFSLSLSLSLTPRETGLRKPSSQPPASRPRAASIVLVLQSRERERSGEAFLCAHGRTVKRGEKSISPSPLSRSSVGQTLLIGGGGGGRF